MNYSVKKHHGAFFWKTNLSLEEVERQLATGRITEDWLICPLGDSSRAAKVSDFMAQPKIFDILPQCAPAAATPRMTTHNDSSAGCLFVLGAFITMFCLFVYQFFDAYVDRRIPDDQAALVKTEAWISGGAINVWVVNLTGWVLNNCEAEIRFTPKGESKSRIYRVTVPDRRSRDSYGGSLDIDVVSKGRWNAALPTDVAGYFRGEKIEKHEVSVISLSGHRYPIRLVKEITDWCSSSWKRFMGLFERTSR